MSSKRWRVAAATALFVGVVAPFGVGIGQGQAAPASDLGADVDAEYAIVQLAGDPISTAKETQPAPGKKVRWEAREVQNYRAKLAAQRNTFKRWLKENAPGAKVTGEFDVSLNAVALKLNGTSLDTIRSSPLVVNAQYQVAYHKLDGAPVDPDLALISAIEAWGGGGAAGAGAGIKVAVIDSGIDQDHPCFDDMGDSDGPNNYTNNKVIVAKVFANRAASLGFDAEAIDSHGTHVAGTIACDFETEATVAGVTIPHLISGVAPAALLGNYNVFPGNIDNARSEDILNALDAAFEDEMNVANMSLGGNASGIKDLLTMAVDNLDRAGMVIAVAAGNEGPGFSTVGSPGSAERALTAGASTVPHQVVNTITVPAVTGEDIDVVEGDFGALTTGIDVPIRVLLDPASTHPLGLNIACAPLASTDQVDPADGIWAVIGRNVCDFSVKMRNVRDAGYSGAIVVNREPGAFVMGQNGDADQPDIPGIMVSVTDGPALIAADGEIITINGAGYVNPYGDPDVMAGFSSEGPTDVDRRIKPDVVAPGANVLSSIPGGEFAFFNGTSMATPHLAGAAAVVKGQHPLWDAWQIRSAIVNTADQGVLTPNYGDDTPDDPNLVGNGRLNLKSAVGAEVLLDPVSISFGQIPNGSGATRTAMLTVQNTSGAAVDVTIGASGGTDEASFSASATVGAGDTATIPVTVSFAKKATPGPSWADLEVIDAGGAVIATAQLFVLIG